MIAAIVCGNRTILIIHIALHRIVSSVLPLLAQATFFKHGVWASFQARRPSIRDGPIASAQKKSRRCRRL
ncbi:hypothetical protein [Bradyrhizobium sp. HKCCYLR20261]|uniref:hypothetical protein n=1 Tax=unclassified Bradyrhizobium TaxID=2631580 RepID=UPI003EBA13AB